MPIPENYLYITTTYMGYLSAIKQHGPIVHPAKVKKEEAIALMIAGAPIVVHDPVTKMTYPLTMDNMHKTVAQAIHKIPDPIKETVLTGAPKGAGDLGLNKPKNTIKPKVTPDLNKIIAEQELAKKAEAVTEVVEEATESVVVESTKVTVEDLVAMINAGTKIENDVNWQDYTKAERRQIRAALNGTNSTENA